MAAHDPETGPPDPELADELWRLVEGDQGRAFISDGIDVLSRKELFNLAQASLKYSRRVVKRLEKFMRKEHGGTRMRAPATKQCRYRVTKLSPSTGDYGNLVSKHLRSVGHVKRVIGQTEVFTVRRSGRVVAVFGTLKEAEGYVSDQIAIAAATPGQRQTDKVGD